MIDHYIIYSANGVATVNITRTKEDTVDANLTQGIQNVISIFETPESNEDSDLSQY
jgi:hypothetical protein